MTLLENIKNNLISRIMASKNEKLLQEINSILDSTMMSDYASLSPQQIEVLTMSQDDIEMDRLVSVEELEKSDSEWLG